MNLEREKQLIKKPKFSIIIPVYNVENYLSFCLDSVVNQTMLDIEIICINDGSTDNSLEIIQKFAQKDNRIHIINKSNGGLSSARNAGLAIASGEYILFVDSDDMLCENACDVLYREILENKADIIIFGTDIFPQGNNSKERKWLENNLEVERKYYKNDSITALFAEKASKPFVWNECYRFEILKNNDITFDEEVSYGEDMIFLFEIFPKAYNISYIPNKLYKYRFSREGSLMARGREYKEWRIKAHLIIVEKIFDYWDRNGFIECNESALYKWSVSFLGYDIMDNTVDKSTRRIVYNKLLEIIDKYGLYNSKKDTETRRIERNLKNCKL